MARLNRDLSGVTKEEAERMRGWRALPPGEYRFIVLSSDYKTTKNGDGMCLHLDLQCIEREHERVKLRDFLTLEHDNPQTVQIANARLKQLAIACGHPNPDFIGDSRELHNKPFLAILTREKVEQYGDAEGFKNQIARYKSVGASRMPADRGVRSVEGPRTSPPAQHDDHPGEPPF